MSSASTTASSTTSSLIPSSIAHYESDFTKWGKWVVIGVVCGVAILVVLMLCCCLVYRRHKKSKKAKYDRDSEAGAYKSHAVEEVHRPIRTDYASKESNQYSAPAYAPPARAEPAYSGQAQSHIHARTTVGQQDSQGMSQDTTSGYGGNTASPNYGGLTQNAGQAGINGYAGPAASHANGGFAQTAGRY